MTEENKQEYMSVLIQKEIYELYSNICKKEGWIIRSRITNFIKAEINLFSKHETLDDGKNKKLTEFGVKK